MSVRAERKASSSRRLRSPIALASSSDGFPRASRMMRLTSGHGRRCGCKGARPQVPHRPSEAIWASCVSQASGSSFFASRGWKDVVCVARKWQCKTGVQWILKGFPPVGRGDTEHVTAWQYCDKDDPKLHIHVSKDPPRGPKVSDVYEVRGPRRSSFSTRACRKNPSFRSLI